MYRYLSWTKLNNIRVGLKFSFSSVQRLCCFLWVNMNFHSWTNLAVLFHKLAIIFPLQTLCLSLQINLKVTYYFHYVLQHAFQELLTLLVSELAIMVGVTDQCMWLQLWKNLPFPCYTSFQNTLQLAFILFISMENNRILLC